MKLAPFNYTCYFLEKQGFSILKYPDNKQDYWRRSLRPGMKIAVSNTTEITLDKILSAPKKGLDGKISFRIKEHPTDVIVFYPNKEYFRISQLLIENESCAVRKPPTICVDSKFRWSIETYVCDNKIALHHFISFIHYLLKNGPIKAINFSELSVMHYVTDGEPVLMPVMPKPIFPSKNNYVALVSSLINYYKQGHFVNECPTLYQFLELCLKESDQKYLDYFYNFASEVAALPKIPTDLEKTAVVSKALGKQEMVWDSSDLSDENLSLNFPKTLALMRDQILERRELLITLLATSKEFSTDDNFSIFSKQYKEAKKILIKDFIETFPKEVRAWILPPENPTLKLFEKESSCPSTTSSAKAASST